MIIDKKYIINKIILLIFFINITFNNNHKKNNLFTDDAIKEIQFRWFHMIAQHSTFLIRTPGLRSLGLQLLYDINQFKKIYKPEFTAFLIKYNFREDLIPTKNFFDFMIKNSNQLKNNIQLSNSINDIIEGTLKDEPHSINYEDYNELKKIKNLKSIYDTYPDQHTISPNLLSSIQNIKPLIFNIKKIISII